jgi:hypothetical protein
MHGLEAIKRLNSEAVQRETREAEVSQREAVRLEALKRLSADSEWRDGLSAWTARTASTARMSRTSAETLETGLRAGLEALETAGVHVRLRA